MTATLDKHAQKTQKVTSDLMVHIVIRINRHRGGVEVIRCHGDREGRYDRLGKVVELGLVVTYGGAQTTKYIPEDILKERNIQ